MRRKYSFIAISCIFIITVTKADTYWLPFDENNLSSEPPNIVLVEDNAERTVVDIYIPGVFVEEVIENDYTFQKITIPKYGSTTETGKPMLPLIGTFIAIPHGVEIAVSIIDSTSLIFQDYDIYPVLDSSEFYIDSTFYASDTLYPGYLFNFSTGNIREQRVSRLMVAPLRYDPSTKLLKCYPFLRVEIIYSGSGIANELGTGPLEKVCRDIILNYQEGPLLSDLPPGAKGTVTRPDNPWSSTVYADYLIMVQQELYNSTVVDSFAQWKADYDGFDVAIVEAPRTSDVDWCITEIYNNIQYAYHNWVAPHMPDGKLGYVLLVGDVKRGSNWYLPWRREGHINNVDTCETPTDNWYACVDTVTPDRLPDILFGRISVSTAEELLKITHKIISYESGNFTEDWRKKIFLTSGFPPNEMFKLSETFPYIRYLAEPAGYSVNEIHYADFCNNDSIEYWNKYYINQGRWIVNYMGHGTSTIWSYGGLSIDNIEELTNVGKLPFVLSFSCKTGNLESPTCLGEKFVNVDSVGAIGYLGASKGSYNPDDNYLCEAIFDGIFDVFLYQIGEIVT